MTLTAREPPLHTATRAVNRLGDNLATLGMHVSFYFRTIGSIPYALSKFRKHVIAQISEVSFGTSPCCPVAARSASCSRCLSPRR